MPLLSVPPDIQVELGPGETVLDGLYRDGYAYRVGCRRGGCGICKVDLLSGSVSYPKTVARTVLTDAERADGTCLSCRAVPSGDVTIAVRTGRVTRHPLLAGLVLAATPELDTSNPTSTSTSTSADEPRGELR